MADDFGAIVEQATGRRVRSYVSDTDLAEQVAIEVLLLGASLEDMSGFEAAGDSGGSRGSSKGPCASVVPARWRRAVTSRLIVER